MKAECTICKKEYKYGIGRVTCGKKECQRARVKTYINAYRRAYNKTPQRKAYVKAYYLKKKEMKNENK